MVWLVAPSAEPGTNAGSPEKLCRTDEWGVPHAELLLAGAEGVLSWQ